MTDQKPPQKPERKPGNLSISVGGNVGPGAVIGPNSSVRADKIAGRDIITTNEVTNKTPEDFYRILEELRRLIEVARQEGELDEAVAKVALEHVQSATDLAKQKPPPKRPLLRKLQDLSDLLDGAADTIESAGGAARVIVKAVPIAALLLKLASYLF
jgi:hypothetical protein